MFRFFKRKARGQGNADENWSVATGQDNGKSLVFRIRTAPPDGVTKKEYCQLVVILWKCDGGENGMPNSADNQKMVLLEDLMDRAIEDSGQAFLTVVVTGNGVKEWQWYTKSEAEFMSLLNRALSGHEVFPIQISAQPDPEWSAYMNFLNAVSGT
ncbi:MAG: DUF695 domain-containing protein [Planctomycetota bacterium]